MMPWLVKLQLLIKTPIALVCFSLNQPRNSRRMSSSTNEPFLDTLSIVDLIHLKVKSHSISFPLSLLLSHNFWSFWSKKEDICVIQISHIFLNENSRVVPKIKGSSAMQVHQNMKERFVESSASCWTLNQLIVIATERICRDLRRKVCLIISKCIKDKDFSGA